MKSFFVRLALLGVVLTGVGATAQPTYFSNRYPISGAIGGATTLIANGTGFVAAGQTTRPAVTELSLTFVDSAGGLQLTRFYQHYRGVNPYPGLNTSLMRTPDGGMALAGSLYLANAVGALWRFNAQGDTLWTRTYGGGEVIVRTGCVLPDGGFLLVGVERLAQTTSVLLTIRTDPAGHELWRRHYDLNAYEELQAASPTPDGGYLVTGYSEVPPHTSPLYSNSQAVVLKLDSVGNIEWQSQRGRQWTDAAGPGLPTPDGGYLVCGIRSDRLFPSGYPGARTTLTKFDAAGAVLWERSYGPSEFTTIAIAIHATADGGYVVAGSIAAPAVNNLGADIGYALKVCADGDSVWYHQYRLLQGVDSNNYLWGLVAATDGGFAGAGFVQPRSAPDTGTQDAWIMKIDANGYLQAGGAPPRRSCVVGLPEAGTEAAAAVVVWPNPAPDGRFTVQASPPAAYTVTDVVGRVVATGPLRGGETVVDLSAAPAGLYLLRLTWPTGRTSTHKLVR